MDNTRKRHSSLPLFLGFLLILTLSACGGNKAKTTAEAPDNANTTGTTTTTTAPGTTANNTAGTTATGQGNLPNDTQAAQGDAQSGVRRNQLNSDIRAREQRNNTTGGTAANRNEGDLASEVRSKLEANIPRGDLTVTANNEDITVSGVVKSQAELNKIEPLAKQIKGVRTVTVKAVVNPAG